MGTTWIDQDKKEPLSIAQLSEHVILHLNWKFISFPEKNTAIDGVFEIFSNSRKTGEHIFVEVKTGTSYQTRQKDTAHVTLTFSDKDRFGMWKRIWQKVPGAMILVYVDYENKNAANPKFYWVDLKNPNSYAEDSLGMIRIPITHTITDKFCVECKSLIDYRQYNIYKGQMPTLKMEVGDFDYIKLSKLSLNKAARKQYRKWSKKSDQERTNPKFGEVIVSRAGWQHISRRTRQKMRIIQSWQLLTVAEKMVKNISYSRQIQTKRKWRYIPETNTIIFKEYYYLKARVKFIHRRETIVYVILRKIIEQSCFSFEISSSRVWFYSIYEGERGFKKGNQISK